MLEHTHYKPHSGIERKRTMDITMYGDQELSLHVMNDEYLYHEFLRCHDEDDLHKLVCAFTYTDAQFDDLHEALCEEIQENWEPVDWPDWVCDWNCD